MNLKPILAYREDRADWRAVLRLSDVMNVGGAEWCNAYEYTIDMSLESFCFIVREGVHV